MKLDGDSTQPAHKICSSEQVCYCSEVANNVIDCAGADYWGLYSCPNVPPPPVVCRGQQYANKARSTP